MNFKDFKHIFFLGIGGIGMSALARYFNHYKFSVSGYDKNRTELCTELEMEGIRIHYEENEQEINDLIKQFGGKNILVIYTPAVPQDHLAFHIFKSHAIEKYKRAEILGEISKQFKTLAVAGTHGKTTTSTLLFHILKSAGKNVSGFLGGISNNYNKNLILGSAEINEEKLLVVEADEYDRSFLKLHPFGAIVTSVDADHLDIYNTPEEVVQSYSQFCNQVNTNGILLVKKNVDNTLKLSKERLNYAVNLKTDFYAKNIIIRDAEYYFDLEFGGEIINNLHLGIPGLHNVENAVAACAIAIKIGVDSNEIRNALRSFKGVKRRFEYRIKRSDLVFIDDYAHHPEELKATISSVRQLYPDKKITGVFQPHLFSRTKDFADEFAKSLELLDETILLDIYPAREKPIEGVSSELLIQKMKSKNKSIVKKWQLIEQFKNHRPEILITMGAGDIDQLVPELEKALLN